MVEADPDLFELDKNIADLKLSDGKSVDLTLLRIVRLDENIEGSTLKLAKFVKATNKGQPDKSKILSEADQAVALNALLLWFARSMSTVQELLEKNPISKIAIIEKLEDYFSPSHQNKMRECLVYGVASLEQKLEVEDLLYFLKGDTYHCMEELLNEIKTDKKCSIDEYWLIDARKEIKGLIFDNTIKTRVKMRQMQTILESFFPRLGY